MRKAIQRCPGVVSICSYRYQGCLIVELVPVLWKMVSRRWRRSDFDLARLHLCVLRLALDQSELFKRGKNAADQLADDRKETYDFVWKEL